MDHELFFITAEQLAGAFDKQKGVYDEQGYHTWDYWRVSDEGMAALCRAIVRVFEDNWPEEFSALWDSAEE